MKSSVQRSKDNWTAIRDYLTPSTMVFSPLIQFVDFLENVEIFITRSTRKKFIVFPATFWNILAIFSKVLLNCYLLNRI